MSNSIINGSIYALIPGQGGRKLVDRIKLQPSSSGLPTTPTTTATTSEPATCQAMKSARGNGTEPTELSYLKRYVAVGVIPVAQLTVAVTTPKPRPCHQT